MTALVMIAVMLFVGSMALKLAWLLSVAVVRGVAILVYAGVALAGYWMVRGLWAIACFLWAVAPVLLAALAKGLEMALSFLWHGLGMAVLHVREWWSGSAEGDRGIAADFIRLMAAFLPSEARERYHEEWTTELYDLRVTQGASRRCRFAYLLRVLFHLLSLRRVLAHRSAQAPVDDR